MDLFFFLKSRGRQNRSLNIKYILNHYGSLQDGPLTVGELFENPAGDDVSKSIVRVVAVPPTLSDLRNPQRFVSLAPDSSARPLKRTLYEMRHPNLMNSIEGRQGSAKRLKLQGSRWAKNENLGRTIDLRERFHSPVTQVLDSQPSLARQSKDLSGNLVY